MTTFLFTTLPTNDLGLLTRSLPIARELAEQGHTILFCSPAKAPSRLIAEAGFDNLLPRHPIYDLMAGDQSLQGLVRFITSGHWRQRYGNLFRFLGQLIPALPIKSAPNTIEVWDVDHAGALMGLLNEGFVTRLCEEAGELASEVNHFEDTGAKRLKHGLPDRKALAKEVQDVIRTAMNIARYYDIEQELRDAIDQSYHTKIDEGYIVDPLL